jgi:cytidylate kinase
MTVITLSWQLGIAGEQIGELLGERLGLPVVNRQIVAAIMRALHLRAPAAEATERLVPGWQIEMSAGLSEWFGVAELRTALGQAEQAHRTTERLLHEAARQPCVLVGRGGFAALADHPGARHVRLSAPRAWRIDRVAAEHVVSHGEAARRELADDRMRRAYVEHYYGRRLDDPANFHLVIAADRFTPDEVADIVVAAVPAQTPRRAAGA